MTVLVNSILKSEISYYKSSDDNILNDFSQVQDQFPTTDQNRVDTSLPTLHTKRNEACKSRVKRTKLYTVGRGQEVSPETVAPRARGRGHQAPLLTFQTGTREASALKHQQEGTKMPQESLTLSSRESKDGLARQKRCSTMTVPFQSKDYEEKKVPSLPYRQRP